MRLLLLLFFLPALAIGQSRTITGTLVDEETGEPLIGANVVVQHRCGLNGTLVRSCYYTDVNGAFSFAIKWPPQRIIKRWSPPPRIIKLGFMYIGYKTRTVTLDEFRDSTTIAFGLVAVESYSTTFDLGLVALECEPWNRDLEHVDYITTPMFDKSATNFGSRINQDEIQHIPLR